MTINEIIAEIEARLAERGRLRIVDGHLFRDCTYLLAEVKRLHAALADASATIHSEYCTSKVHEPVCAKVLKALEGE